MLCAITKRFNLDPARVLAVSACLLISLNVSCVPPRTQTAPTATSGAFLETATIAEPSPLPTMEAPQATVPGASPFGTPIASTIDRDGAASFQPVKFAVRYDAAIEQLPGGLYVLNVLVDRSAGIEAVAYSEVLGDSTGSMVSIGEIVRAYRVFFDGENTWLLAGFPTTNERSLIDLSDKSAATFHVCLEGWDTPSPSGNSLATICTPPDQPQPGQVAIELISLRNRGRVLLEIPSHSGRRNASNSIFWVTEESFIASVGPQDEPCLVRVDQQAMLCAVALLGKPIVVVSSDWIVVQPSVAEAQRVEVVSLDCFSRSADCVPVAEIASEELGAALFQWSPNGERLGVEFGVMLGSTSTRIGFYDTSGWQYHELAEFPPDHGIVGWCPDALCLVVSGEATYLVNLDGKVTNLALELSDPIAVIRVP